ncbi:MAG: UbiD family decarboxylase, partial [Pirellulales bacterium]|nr:UbiD family decarboxylase [Pirellulales bacterium]
MGYRSLRECLTDLERSGDLIRIEQEVDADLEASEIHRRVNAAGGPAILFERVKGCQFPMASNLFGTLDRAKFIFRDALALVRRLINYKIDPTQAFRHPLQAMGAARGAWTMLPKRVRSGPVLAAETTVAQLPQQKSWPDDGGAFVTLPQVYTEDVRAPGWKRSNLGMYRIQLSGGEYRPDDEIGLHYQIHRGIGVHHTAALEEGKPFRVNVFVGGPPAMAVAAVMPLPEGLSELTFAGALNRRRVRMAYGRTPLPVHAEADFCICGEIIPGKLLPEGPFGDHLGYYSLEHPFPVMQVKQVFHRRDAVWPFTVVGRPPQEDTIFGALIHELTEPVIPSVIPGVRAVHAVDAAGVHPLLLAIGSERYTPYSATERPQELLTQSNAILGLGQMSLAKFLWIAAENDDPQLDIHDTASFFRHMLRRVDWRRDLHFQTQTTIDTLDYSGQGLNQGSKVVIAAVGQPIRELPMELPQAPRLPDGFSNPQMCFPGAVAINGPAATSLSFEEAALQVKECCDAIARDATLRQTWKSYPLFVVVDDSFFTAESMRNFLWVTFTRANPATDIHGVEEFTEHKHWGCRGALMIDARRKQHHAPPLQPDAEIARRVDKLGAKG